MANETGNDEGDIPMRTTPQDDRANGDERNIEDQRSPP